MSERVNEPAIVNNAEFATVLDSNAFEKISSKIGVLPLLRSIDSHYKQDLKEIAEDSALLKQALYDEKYSIKAVDSLNKLAAFDIEGAKIAIPLMEENLLRINQNIKINAVEAVEREEDNNKICLQAMSSLIKFNSNSAKNLIGKYLPFIFRMIEKSLQGYDYSMIVGSVVASGYKKDFEKIKNWWLNFLDKPSFTVIDPWHIISSLFGEEKQISFGRTNNLIKLAFEKYGWHNVEKLLRERSDAGKVKNLRAMWNFERHARGGVNILKKEFGIANFGRYPPDVLAHQYEERNRFDKPYGLIIYPKYDHNLAFFNNYTVLSDFFRSLENKYLLRIIEVESKRDIIRNLIHLDRKYGAQKISFVIFGSHGEEDNMRFGEENTKMNILSIDELTIETISKFRKFFSEDVIFILNSCSTGVERGIGQQLSSSLSCRVIAPDKPCNFYGIKADRIKEKDSLSFNVRFDYDAKTNIYSNGRKL